MPKKPTRRELDAMMADLIKDNYTNAPPLPDHFAAFGSHPKDPMLLAIEQNEGIAELFMTTQIGEQTDNSLEDTLGRAYAHRHKADQLLEKRDFRQARTHYVEAATALCGRIPYRAKFLCDKYLELKSATPSVVATLCCVGAARCMYELREYEEVSGIRLLDDLFCKMFEPGPPIRFSSLRPSATCAILVSCSCLRCAELFDRVHAAFTDSPYRVV